MQHVKQSQGWNGRTPYPPGGGSNLPPRTFGVRRNRLSPERGPGESSRQARPTRPDHHRQRRGTHHAHLAFTAVARRGGWRPVAHRTGRGPPGRRGPRHRRQSRRADVPRCAGVRRQRPRPYEAVLSHVPMEQMAFRSSAVCRGHGRDDRPAQPFGHRGNERGDGRGVVRAT